jgi:hypothetical protein
MASMLTAETADMSFIDPTMSGFTLRSTSSVSSVHSGRLKPGVVSSLRFSPQPT